MEEFNHQQENSVLVEINDEELFGITGGVVDQKAASQALYQGLRDDGRGRLQSAGAAVTSGPKYAAVLESKEMSHVTANDLRQHAKDYSSYSRGHDAPITNLGRF